MGKGIGAFPYCQLGPPFRLVVLCVCLVLLPGWTIKGTQIDKSYYRLTAATRTDLIRAVRRSAPRAGTAYGMAIIDFYPDLRIRAQDGLCRVISASVGLRIKIRLPKWSRDPSTPRSVDRLGRRFERVVTAHEMQHVAIAKRYARDMERRLSRLSAGKDCWELRKRARDLIRTVKARHLDAHRRFDNRTRRQIRRLL